MKTMYCAMSESMFMRQVAELLTMNDWLFHHDDSSSRLIRRRSGAVVRIANTQRGFPDICAARISDGRLIFAELKRDVGPRGGQAGRVLTTEQESWRSAIEKLRTTHGSTVEYFVWRPADLEAIARILAR